MAGYGRSRNMFDINLKDLNFLTRVIYIVLNLQFLWKIYICRLYSNIPHNVTSRKPQVKSWFPNSKAKPPISIWHPQLQRSFQLSPLRCTRTAEMWVTGVYASLKIWTVDLPSPSPLPLCSVLHSLRISYYLTRQPDNARLPISAPFPLTWAKEGVGGVSDHSAGNNPFSTSPSFMQYISVATYNSPTPCWCLCATKPPAGPAVALGWHYLISAVFHFLQFSHTVFFGSVREWSMMVVDCIRDEHMYVTHSRIRCATSTRPHSSFTNLLLPLFISYQPSFSISCHHLVCVNPGSIKLTSRFHHFSHSQTFEGVRHFQHTGTDPYNFFSRDICTYQYFSPHRISILKLVLPSFRIPSTGGLWGTASVQ